MANHIRQQIRERAGTVLTGLTTTGSNVFETRIYPLSNTLNELLLNPSLRFDKLPILSL